MVEAEVEVMGFRLLEAETQVVAWQFEEVGQGLCIRGWNNSFRPGCRR